MPGLNRYFRLLAVVLRGLVRRGAGAALLGELGLRSRVVPNDLDLPAHVDDGRYLTRMDLGRTELVARLGVAGVPGRRHWSP